MFRLKVISGPESGTSYNLEEGKHSIGRESENSIVIPSERISKTHCHLTVHKGGVSIRDAGSTNGTFVNGVLTQKRSLKVGDQVRIGNVVFLVGLVKKQDSFPVEVGSYSIEQSSLVPAVQDIGLPAEKLVEPDPFGDSSATSVPQEAPKDFAGRVKHFFDFKIMPIFFGMNFKFEWKNLVAAIVLGVVLGSAFLTMPTVIDFAQERILAESGKRAQFLSRRLARMNEPILSNSGEDKLTLGDLDKDEGVLAAFIIDIHSGNNRILAPTSKLNTTFDVGNEGVLVKRAAQYFIKGAETGIVKRSGENRIIAIEPLRVFTKSQGKNVSAAMAVVILDVTSSLISSGDAWMNYSNALIWAGILGILAFFIIVKLTLKPFQILNEDIDRVLKGEMGQVTHEFKIQELNPLWDIVNVALQRARSANVDLHSDQESGSSEDWIAPYKSILDLNPGWVGFAFDKDKKVIWLNHGFQEASGIRESEAMGRTISEVARDQSFVAICDEFVSRSEIGGAPVSEDTEFSGIPFQLMGFAIGKKPTPEVWLVIGKRKDDGY